MSQATDGDGTVLLDGVTVPLVTPLDSAGRPDADAVDAQLASLADAGITKLLLLGTNGEGPAFGAAESADFAAAVSEKWLRRVSDAVVSVAIFGSSTRETICRAEAMLNRGAAVLVIPPPHYFRYDVDELADFYRDVASLGAPVVVYNAARYTGNPITEPLLWRVAETPGVIGVKDSGGEDSLLVAAIEVSRVHRSFGVSQGNERRLAWALQQGASGITPGLANIAPYACTELVRAWRDGSPDAAYELQSQLDVLAEIHRIRPGVACMKAALSILGFSAPRPAAPTHAYSGEELHALRARLAGAPVRLIGELPS